MNLQRTQGWSPRGALVTLTLLALLGGCATKSNKAPVEDRSAATTPAATSEAPPKVLPGAENAGKPGYYTVKPGDTLIRIAIDNGQNYRDIARWNAMDNPNLIEVGQVLRVVPPVAETVAATKPVAAPGKVETRPLDTKAPPLAAPATAPSAAASAASAPVVVAAPAPAPASTPAPAAPRDPDEDLNWTWPAAGPVAAGFDEARTKGLQITGKAGDPVLAAADGRVVYAGSGLRGYGNLVIVKHNTTYLTAYAHNQTLLVKEDQVVRRGQKIAEMGSSDADRVQLHFEIRRQGKPVDPAKLLPPR